ncbi:MAG: hypothetical protein MRY59_02970 [Aquisalinus sp.]|nr:hypothetical protein [Aquisalinus sp.]
MTQHIASALLFLAGLINFLPLFAITSADRIARAYGIDISDPNTEILLRHRALLFGLLGGFMMLSAFRHALQPYAIIGGALSMGGFILLAYLAGDYNDSIRSIIRADYLALALLAAAIALKLFTRN